MRRAPLKNNKKTFHKRTKPENETFMYLSHTLNSNNDDAAHPFFISAFTRNFDPKIKGFPAKIINKRSFFINVRWNFQEKKTRLSENFYHRPFLSYFFIFPLKIIAVTSFPKHIHLHNNSFNSIILNTLFSWTKTKVNSHKKYNNFP